MTETIHNISQIAQNYDAIVFDQWGVLHNGSTPYEGAIQAIEKLHKEGHHIAVLSNSGKRSLSNALRIKKMGFPTSWFEQVFTSGEALWQDIDKGTIQETHFYPIEREKGDAMKWKEALDIDISEDIHKAEAVLLMGLPDLSTNEDWDEPMRIIVEKNIPVYCSNPDEMSPRAGKTNVISPGRLAKKLQSRGSKVIFYGKPHAPVFARLENRLNTKKILMVGDSLDHDILGAAGVGWDSLLIQSGLYINEFANGNAEEVLENLCQSKNTPPPTYQMEILK